jgi:hypothetical protein
MTPSERIARMLQRMAEGEALPKAVRSTPCGFSRRSSGIASRMCWSALAGVVHGTDEVTSGVDICPQLKPANLERLNRALEELSAHQERRKAAGFDVSRLDTDGVTRLYRESGEIKLVPRPPGSTGYDDARRKATREPLGHGIRASAASVRDLARILVARANPGNAERLARLRRIAEREGVRGPARSPLPPARISVRAGCREPY